MLPDFSTNLIIAIFRQCSHTVYILKSIVKAANLLLKIVFSRFFLSEFVYDTGGSVYIT